MPRARVTGGDGITPDVDVKAIDNTYPLPYAPWGSVHDVALCAALESVGCELFTPTRARVQQDVIPAIAIAEPLIGIRLYAEE